MPLPTFLIVGAMKAGTTSLSDALSMHPDVFIPAAKEPNALLSQRVLTDKRSEYEALFEFGRAAKARGEASTAYTKGYMGGHDSASIARELLGPDIRLIYLVRDPLARAASHARHTEEAGRVFDVTTPITPSSPEAEGGYYAHQIEPWIQEFGRSAVLVLDLATLVEEWPSTGAQVCEHIRIDPSPLPSSMTQANSSGDSRPAGGSLGRILATDSYRQTVQNRLPLPVRRRLRTALVRRSPASLITSESLLVTEATLLRWQEEIDRLHDLTGVRCSIPDLQQRLDA